MDFCLLPDNLLYLCDTWFETDKTGDQWAIVKRLEPGDSHPHLVTRNTDGLRGVAKPFKMTREPGATLDPQREFWAAREKLAFGLAHLLELPVPPVVLWDRGPTEARRYMAISAYVGDFIHWSSPGNALSETHQRQWKAVTSALHAFDTWISGQNRSEAHALLHKRSAENGELRCAFVDHSGGFEGNTPWPEVGEKHLPLGEDHAAIREIIDRIQKLDASIIGNLIDRIPPEFLSCGRETLYDELIRRRGLLPTILHLE